MRPSTRVDARDLVRAFGTSVAYFFLLPASMEDISPWSGLGPGAMFFLLRKEPRFEGGEQQERAYRRELKQDYIPFGTDLARLRATLTARIARPDSGYVAGAAVAVSAAILFYAWPKIPTFMSCALAVRRPPVSHHWPGDDDSRPLASTAMRRRDPLPRWAGVLIFAVVTAAAIGAEVELGLWPILRSMIVICAFFWCFKPGHAKRRAMEERLGGHEEARRFAKAWASGVVPADADRSRWVAELPHLPDGTVHRRIRSSSALACLVLTILTAGGFAAAVALDSEALRVAVPLLVPFPLLFAAITLMFSVVKPPDARTERLRRALERTP